MRVAFAAGIFDLTHQGHVELFEIMRSNADVVIAVVHDDEGCYLIKNKIPVQSLDHRLKNLEIIGLVDSIRVCFGTDPTESFRAVMMEYKDHELTYYRGDDMIEGFPGKDILDKYKIPIIYKPYTRGVSSSELRDKL